MATYKISRAGTVLGEYDEAIVRRYLDAGSIKLHDYGWTEGMTEWKQLHELGFRVSTPSVPAAAPAWAPSAQAAAAAGERPFAYYAWMVAAIFVLILLLQGYAYVTLKAPLAKALGSDSRNRSIDASAYYRYNMPFGSVVLNIDDIGSDTKNVDTMRVMLQFAQSQKHSNHDWLILSCRGKEKFMIRGSHFKTMGVDYGSENPMYTMRTLPENVYRMDGRRAYPVWEGGALGVMAEQMKNFSEFTTEWLR